jgi:hypothetical protein
VNNSLQNLISNSFHVKHFSVKKSIFQKSRFRKNKNSETLSKDKKNSNSTFCSTSWYNSKRSNLHFRITKMKIHNCGEKLSPETNFLGLIKINSLLSNKSRHKISKSLFGKSTKFFHSSEILSSGSKMNKHFMSKLSNDPLIELRQSFRNTHFWCVIFYHPSKHFLTHHYSNLSVLSHILRNP